MTAHIGPDGDGLLAQLTGDARVTTRLRERLSADAARQGLLDVAYTTFDSPIGRLLLAATPDGLVRVAFEHEGHEAVLEQLSALISPRILSAPRALADTVGQLEEYFAGRRTSFELALDLRLARGFQRAVLEQLRSIRYGTTATYAHVAEKSGSPRAVRAVGTACARNPVPVVIPCHRVVRSDGALGGYRGGPSAKRDLLRLEGAA